MRRLVPSRAGWLSAVIVWASLAATPGRAAECLYGVSVTNRIVIIETAGRNVLGIYPVSGQDPFDIAVASNRAFVTATGPPGPTGAPGTVAVVDVSTGAEVAVLAVEVSPLWIVATHDQRTVYVAKPSGSAQGILEIDAASAAVRQSIAVEGPTGLALKPDDSALYAISRATRVAVVEEGRVTDRINLRQGLSEAIAYYPQASGDLLLLGAAGKILALDLAQRRVAFTIDGTSIATSMAVDPRLGRVYWGTSTTGHVGVADVVTHDLVGFISLCPAFACIEFSVLDLALSGDGRFAYATSVQRGVSVVDLQTLARVEPIAVPSEAGPVRGLTVAECPEGIPIPSPLPTPTPTPPIVCDPRWVTCDRPWFTCESDSDCIVSDGLDCCTCSMGGGPQVAINRGRQSTIASLQWLLCRDVACLAVALCRGDLEAVCREGLCALVEGVTPMPTPPRSATSAASPTPTATPTAIPPACAGDCNRDGAVTVDEVVTLVAIALGHALLHTCPGGDANGDGAISVDDILGAVHRAMVGCHSDCRATGCPLGTTCECCCGSWECLPPLTFCCALAC
jgi:DNA-binding beta-propeller fold protein YncE